MNTLQKISTPPKAQSVIKAAIVDDHGLFRRALSDMLNDKDIQVVLEAGNGNELIEKMDRCIPDVVLLDINMPVMDGIETLQFLSSHYPQVRVIILTMHSEEGFVMDLLKRGAKGFLTKNSSLEEVKSTIMEVLENDTPVIEEFLKKSFRTLGIKGKSAFIPPLKMDFSKRQLEILTLICKGHTSTEIANKLFITKRTVDGHRERLMEKLEVRTSSELAAEAVRKGLVD